MEKLSLTQEQIKTIFKEIAKKENGFAELMRLSLNALMEAEREIYKEEYSDVSNGFRTRRILGDGGMQIVLDVPRTRRTNFYPVLLAILNDRESEARELAFKLYSSGLTTEQVGEIFESLYGRYYSKSQVSRMFDNARERIKEWLERPLESYYPIVYIDVIFISTRRGDQISKEAYYTVLGVKPDRTREVLAIGNMPTESSLGWQIIIEELKGRGVRRIDLFISDALPGIEDAVAYNFSQSSHQFCVVHLERNILNGVKKNDKDEIKKALKEVFRTDKEDDSIAMGIKRWEAFIKKYGSKYPHIKRMQNKERYRYYFTYLDYHYKIRPMIYTTNWIERLNRDYRRTTRMRGALPNADAALLLLGSVAMEKKAYRRKVANLDYETKFDWEA